MPFHMTPFALAAMAVFIVGSVIVGAAMAGAGGWRDLAARYPVPPGAPPDEGGERFRFSSLRTAGGTIGTATYESCVTVGVGARGISLALWAPFRLFHPAMFIPWTAVERCRRVDHMAGALTQLDVRGGGTLSFVGRAGASIARRVPCGGNPS